MTSPEGSTAGTMKGPSTSPAGTYTQQRRRGVEMCSSWVCVECVSVCVSSFLDLVAGLLFDQEKLLLATPSLRP